MKVIDDMTSQRVKNFRDKFEATNRALDLGLENIKVRETRKGKDAEISVSWSLDGKEDHTVQKVRDVFSASSGVSCHVML
jgi:hypothetical protein